MPDNDKTLKAIAKSLEAIKDEMVKQTSIWKQINDKTHSWNIPNPDGCDDEDIDDDAEPFDDDAEPFDDDEPEMGDTKEETN